LFALGAVFVLGWFFCPAVPAQTAQTVSISPLPRDYDGDGKADPALIINGDWYAWLSSRNYKPCYVTNQQSAAGGSLAAGDIDGDGRLDGGMAAGNYCGYWLSSRNFSLDSANLGQSGSLLFDDLNLDGKADVFLVTANSLLFYFSSKQNYQCYAPVDIGMPGRLVLGYYNTDNILDIGWVSGNTWHLIPSNPAWANDPNFDILYYGFVQIERVTVDETGAPFLPDLDGDRRGDPTVYVEDSGWWYAWLSANNFQKVGPFKLVSDLPTYVGGMVTLTTNGAVAIAAMTDGIVEYTSGDVRVNGTRLGYGMPLDIPWKNNQTLRVVLPVYYGALPNVQAGTAVTMTAAKATGESVYQSATYPVPGQVVLSAPTNTLPFMLGQDINLAWNPVENAPYYFAGYLALDNGGAGDEDDSGSYVRLLEHPAQALTVPATNILEGYADLGVSALSGDLAALMDPEGPTNSFLIVESIDSKINYVNTPSPPGSLRIAEESQAKYWGFRVLTRESDPMQIWTNGTITVNIKMRRFKASVACVLAFDSQGTQYVNWEKCRIFRRQNRNYTVSFAARPYTTVLIITHDASYRGGYYQY
jgi:hypothetical protein